MTATYADVLDVIIGGTNDGQPLPAIDRSAPGARVFRRIERRPLRATDTPSPACESDFENYVWRLFEFAGRPYLALVWANFANDSAAKYVLRELIDRGLARDIDPAKAAPAPWRKRDRRPHILRSSIKCDRLEDGRRAWTVTACDQWGQEITTKTSVENFREIRDEFDATAEAIKAAEAALELDRRRAAP